MSDPLEIPEHIRRAAAEVEIFFKASGIKEWALMGIQSRNDNAGSHFQAAVNYFTEIQQECQRKVSSKNRIVTLCRNALSQLSGGCQHEIKSDGESLGCIHCGKSAEQLATDGTGKVLLTKEQQRDKAIEVLTYAASLCDSKNLSFKNAGYRAACDEIKVCLLASIERMESGDRMEATAVASSA